MSYQTELIDRIKDSNAWPSFERPKYLNELNEQCALRKLT